VRSERLGARVIAEELNMNRETVRQIVKEDLGMRKINTKMVPRILTRDPKRRLYIAFDLRNAEMSLPVVKRGVLNTTRKQNDRACSGKQNSQKKKKARMSRSQVKTMLLVFLRSQGDSSL
jgi:hypothetical protein